jgi:hypothetical protein
VQRVQIENFTESLEQVLQFGCAKSGRCSAAKEYCFHHQGEFFRNSPRFQDERLTKACDLRRVPARFVESTVGANASTKWKMNVKVPDHV